MWFKKKQTKTAVQTTSVDTDALQSLLNTEVEEEESFRYVTLRAESCCGCGCDEFKVRRKVPVDSELQNGDYIGVNIHDDDEIL